MTDDPVEALWFLYTVSRRSLSKVAGRTRRTSALTYFHQALRSALERSNNIDTFMTVLEKTIDLDFTRDYKGDLPSRRAFVDLFSVLKKQGMLSFMPEITERERERRTEFAAEDKEEEEIGVRE